MIRKLLAALMALAFSHVAYAQQTQSTINPLVPAQNGPLTSSILRNNFAAAYNDINYILGRATPLVAANNLSDLPNAATARTNLGLGALAILNTLPVPGPAILGGVKSVTCSTAQFVNAVDTSGNATCAMPSTGSSTAAAGVSGQFQTNSSGSLAGVTVSGDFTLSGTTGVGTIANGTVSSAKMASGAAVANIGYAPLNKAGDTMTGTLVVPSITTPGLPGLSSSVEATGTAGLDGNSWFIYNAPTNPTYNAANTNTLRVDRNANYTGGAAGNLSAIWGNCTAHASDTTFEWCSKFTLDNLATGAAQNLSLNATTTAHTGSSPSWATNFVLQNLDGETDPTNVRVNSEFDLFVNGTDANKVRHNIELILARPSNAGAAAYAMSGMWINAGSGSTYQNGILFDNGGVVPGAGTGSGAYVVGINMAGASYSGAAIGIPSLSKIALDLAPSGTFNRSISFTASGLTYATGSGNALLVDDSGNVKALTSVRSTVKTFATLPACSGTNEGAMIPVTDSTTQTFGQTMAGGGGFHVNAYCNSAVWTVH